MNEIKNIELEIHPDVAFILCTVFLGTWLRGELGICDDKEFLDVAFRNTKKMFKLLDEEQKEQIKQYQKSVMDTPNIIEKMTELAYQMDERAKDILKGNE